ncbi:ABC-type Mn2+/Zn2+ transport system, permease component [Rubidibacter lacunae KORDI 51-2]|uniref:ABC-type Mn2+/Zn2+ transport system, permease component n=1 Tax=Rubidibacter lacunae KORDI 51-2 TaxID=582515 RepID=U5DP99_9CHRO|nr:metal ABC transporter permease [Rubidibacter lacunae]ERN42662.1 ABC-type Mn2+/Zn2+ transport system, permease component [Rubidibacter lacunae KORDI 51-2]
MLDWLLEPLSLAFMQRALLLGIFLGVLCAVVGSYAIVRQMGMLAHTVSHSVMAGLPIAYVAGLALSFGALVAGVTSALMLYFIESRSRVKTDAAMALILSSFVAIGLTLVSILPGANRIDLVHVLFGNILGVKAIEVWGTLAITILVIVLVRLFYKELLFYTFDPIGAQASGLPVKWYNAALIVAMTVTIVVCLPTVGALLVVALLVAPAVTAYLLVKELHQMMWVGSFIGALSSILGMYLSYYLDAPSGSTVVLVAFCFFILAFIFSPSQGLIRRAVKFHRGVSLATGQMESMESNVLQRKESFGQFQK